MKKNQLIGKAGGYAKSRNVAKRRLAQAKVEGQQEVRQAKIEGLRQRHVAVANLNVRMRKVFDLLMGALLDGLTLKQLRAIHKELKK